MSWTAQLLALLIAQSLSAPPKFEVASIKPSPAGVQTIIFRYPGGRFAAKKATLKSLIKFAFDVSDRQIFVDKTGGPEWIDIDRFDVEATPEEGAGVEQKKKDQQIKLMLQGLLAERFHLEIQHETRELPIYALIVAKGDPKLERNTGKPFGITREHVDGAKSISRKFEFDNVSMGLFAAQLSGQIGGDEIDRTVVDQTGLSGDFDFTLSWYLTPRATSMAPDMGPSIFSAIQAQFGLKLKPDKGPVETIRIVHAERPSAN